MRICLVSPELAPWSGWGIGTYAANMAAACARSGDDVHILTNPSPHLAAGSADLLGEAAVHVLDRSQSLRTMPARAADRSLAILEALRALHEGHDFEAIEFADCYGDGYHTIAAKHTTGAFARTTIAVRLHSPIFLLRDLNEQHTLNRRIALITHMESEAIRGADVVLAPSRAILDRITAYLGGKIRAAWRDRPTPAHVARNPFDPALLAASQSDHTPLRARPRKTILSWGRLEYRKGFHLLIDAAGRLLDDGLDIQVHIAGADTDAWPGTRSALAMLQRLVPAKWPDRFTFEPNLTRGEVAARMNAAATCCFPSLWENFPYACLEAMSAGCVVVGSDAGGMAEMIRDGEDGYLFRAGDAASLAAQLRAALVNEQDNARLRANAPQRVNELTAPDRVVEEFRAIVSSPHDWIPACAGMTETVAVIIPHRDMPETLPGAIASVRNQTHPPDQIVIVDDGSKGRAARRLLKELERDTDLTVLRRAHAGLAASRNAAMACAHTDFVVPLDADDLLAPTFIERTLTAATRESDTAMVTTLMACFKHDPARPDYLFAPVGFDRDILGAFNCASSCTALLRRDAVLDAGGYNDSMDAYEDWDLYCAMASRGMTSALVPEALVLNRVRTDSMLRSMRPVLDHDIRARIIHKYADLALDSSRTMRLLLADGFAQQGRPTEHDIRQAARRVISATRRYRLADRASRLAHRAGLAPFIRRMLRP